MNASKNRIEHRMLRLRTHSIHLGETDKNPCTKVDKALGLANLLIMRILTPLWLQH